MSPGQVGAVVALVVAGAFVAFGRGVSPTPRSLAAARARLAGGVVDRGDRPVWNSSGGGRSSAHWVGRATGDGLSLAGLTAEAVVGRAVTAAAVVGFVSVMALGAMATVASAPPPLVSLAVVIVAVVGAGGSMVSSARTAARRALADLRRATNDLIQLVAIGLTTDQSVEDAIHFALDTMEGSESRGADLLRAEIVAAPLRGEQVWEPIARVGREHQVRELGEFAHSLERQATHGVSISVTIGALAGSMRARALDRLERESDRANANLAGPTAGFVVATLVFLAYPLVVRIGEAFGG